MADEHNTAMDPRQEELRQIFIREIKDSGAATVVAGAFVGYNYAISHTAEMLHQGRLECISLRTALKELWRWAEAIRQSEILDDDNEAKTFNLLTRIAAEYPFVKEGA